MNTQHDAAMQSSRGPGAVLLGQRIQDARGDTVRRVIAHGVGVHENTLGKWERGETVPDVLQLIVLAKMLSRPVEYFLQPLLGDQVTQEHGSTAAGPVLSTRVVVSGAYVYVPLFDIRNWIDGDSMDDIELVREMHCFRRDYLVDVLGIHHEALLLVQMSGSLAEPVLGDGDLVLVDMHDVAAEGHHLVRVDDAMVIKMLNRKPGRIVVSNNGAAAFEVGVDGGVAGFEILGRCRWVGSRLS